MPEGLHSSELPDGRVLNALVYADADAEASELGPLWDVTVDESTVVAHPLDSKPADLLGWATAAEDRPEWIGVLAKRVERNRSGVAIDAVATCVRRSGTHSRAAAATSGRPGEEGGGSRGAMCSPALNDHRPPEEPAIGRQ